MSQLQVSEINVPNLIKKLKTREWLAPKFQREFVWSTAAVISLINSIIDAKPIGMVTLWEQEDESQLQLEAISIPDSIDGKSSPRYFGDESKLPGRYYAILDGRQRSTALALAFGGLRASSGLYRTAGRYFIDVAALDDAERVKFVTEKEVQKKGLQKLNSAIAQGLFPLEVPDPDSIFQTWMNYLQNIRDPAFYPNNSLPEEVELERRNKILQKSFNGIINTKIAVYVVPKNYSLAEICDIFETLNTTGTKVSTVDLIHSWLYNDSLSQAAPLMLREKIDELGELDGAIGWASSRDRPELIAQMVAATHVALDNKPEPRPMGGSKATRISSVKSQDLLAIPYIFWRKIFDNDVKFASYIGDFQTATAGGPFTMAQCPYPASATIYVALRWLRDFDSNSEMHWAKKHIDALYRAFFWRNVFYNRYDQGFLTQIGTDIREFKTFLNETPKSSNFEQWRVSANSWLDRQVGKEAEISQIEDIVSNGQIAGALRRASLLLFYSRATRDTINTSLDISSTSGNLQLHHIFPRDWCANNVSGPLKKILDHSISDRDWINSACNLMPMHRMTNNEWRKKNPAQVIEEHDVSYDKNTALWDSYFIGEEAFQAMKAGADGLEVFLKLRQRDLARTLQANMRV